MKNAREALEAALKEDASGNICVSYAKEDDFFVVSVSDNGPGLPPQARENMFVAFKGSARAGGSGLGLVIARELTESHGGKLSYVEQEHGARFDIRLPSSKRIS